MFTNGFKYSAKNAFSLIELIITIIIVLIIIGSITPSITKKLNNRSIKVEGTIGTNVNTEFTSDCNHIDENCKLCTSQICMLCTKVCPVGQFIYSSECSCQSCSDKYGNECLSCTDKKCKTCSVGNFVENGSCVSCKTKDNNCLECENLTGKCTKCIEGYDVEDGICEHHIEN